VQQALLQIVQKPSTPYQRRNLDWQVVGGLVGRWKRREFVWDPRRQELKNTFRLREALEAMETEVAQADAIRQLPFEEIRSQA
jgi:hypothetical protein